MKHLIFLFILFILLSASAVFAAEKPNIILILSDDMGCSVKPAGYRNYAVGKWKSMRVYE